MKTENTAGPIADLDTLVDAIAQVVHAANKTYCEILGDRSQVAWAEAPDWQKDSCREGVRNVVTGKVWTEDASHQSWMAKKLQDGWTYGPVKDEQAKTHPCIVPYGKLPEEQRAKDAVFLQTVRAVFRAAQRGSESVRAIPGLVPSHLFILKSIQLVGMVRTIEGEPRRIKFVEFTPDHAYVTIYTARPEATPEEAVREFWEHWSETHPNEMRVVVYAGVDVRVFNRDGTVRDSWPGHAIDDGM